MTDILIAIMLQTLLFAAGFIQWMLQVKHAKRYTAPGLFLLVCMVLVYFLSVLQNVRNYEASTDLREKASKTLELIHENKRLNEKISSQAEEIAEMQRFSTGGDGYCYLIPVLNRSKQEFYVQRVGKYPLYNVQFVIRDQLKAGRIQNEIFKPLSDLVMKNAPKEELVEMCRQRDFSAEMSAAESQFTTPFEMPVLLPESTMKITLPYAISEKESELKYLIRIFCLNGKAIEEVRYRLIRGKWKMSFRVTRGEDGQPKKTLQEEIDPEVPL